MEHRIPKKATIELETQELGAKCRYAVPYEFGGTLCLVSEIKNAEAGETHAGFCGEVICPFCDGMEYREGRK